MAVDNEYDLAHGPWAIKDVRTLLPKSTLIMLTSFQIVYLSILGPLMLAALFEWILWLAAFLYCLVKVYQKADHWSIRGLSVTMIFLFSMFR